MFFTTKRNRRKTTCQALSTEQLEPKAMFSVSPVEPVVALDVGPVNQASYDFQLVERIDSKQGGVKEIGALLTGGGIHYGDAVNTLGYPGAGEDEVMSFISLEKIGKPQTGYSEAVGLDSSTVDDYQQ